ncbi:MAG: MamK family actin-like protein [Thermodesulfovibrionales bacterium]
MKQKSQGETDVLYVGIDLGTSSSAIVASTGERNWVESYVGWPKDFISMKVLGRHVLFGREALQNRLSVDLYRPLERGVIKEGQKDQESVKELIRHMIDLVPRAQDQKIYAVVGVPAESFKVNKIAIRTAVAGFVDSLMVVSEPFAVAYGIDLLNNAMVVDIGAGTVDFCIMHGTIPGEDDQRTIYHAGDYVDQQLHKFLVEKFPNSALNSIMVRQFKEQYSFVGESDSPVVVKIPVDGKQVDHDITAEMKQACESILPAIVETATEMIAKFDPEYQSVIMENIVLAGGGSQIRGLREYVEKSLAEFGPCRARVVEDPVYAGAGGALKLAMDMPRDYWEQI